MMKYVFLFLVLTVFSFSSAVEMSGFYPIDISESPQQLQVGTSLLQIDYTPDLENHLAAQTEENKRLNDILANSSDVLIIRHLPSLEISHKLVSYLYTYYAVIYETAFNEGFPTEMQDYDGVIIASKIPISSPEKISFGSSIRKHLIEFTTFEGDAPAAEFFILNDEVADLDDSLKLDQLTRISEQAELLATKGFQRPCIICVKPSSLPKHTSVEEKNMARGEFVGKENAIRECTRRDSRQNLALVLTKTTSFQDYGLNFGYEIISEIDSIANSSYGCLSSIRKIEKLASGRSNFEKITKSGFASMKLQAKGEREASVSVERDFEGTTKVEGSISVSRDNDDGSRFEISGSGSIERNSDGSTSGSAKAEASFSW